MMLYWAQLWNVTAVSPSISFQDTVGVVVFEFVGILKKFSGIFYDIVQYFQW